MSPTAHYCEKELNMSPTAHYFEKDQQMLEKEEKHESSFDTALDRAGSWGPWQKFMVFVISISQTFSALHCVAAVYLSAALNHHCDLPITSFKDSDLLRNISFPSEGSECNIFNHDYSAINSLFLIKGKEMSKEDLTPFLSTEIIECQSWVYESEHFESTVVSEWNLVCSRRLLKATVQATFMAGILIGSAFFGQVSDRIGRRKTMLLCSLLLLITATSVSFVHNYVLFVTLRFCVALLCAGLMVTNFVLLMEITKPEARSFTGMINGIPFGLGISLVSCFAYFLRDWRTLQLSTGLVCSVLLIYFWILPESPMWLVSKDRPNEALKILKTIAKWNKKVLPEDDQMLALLTQKSSPESDSKKAPSNACVSMMCDQATLVRTPVMRRRCLISFFAWFVSAMVYYGLIFLGANIKANPFLMVLVSGLIEVPSFILAAFFLYKFGRRLISCTLFIICSFFLFIITGVPRDQVFITFFLANVGKFFNTAVFQLCFLYTSELFPTPVRSIAVGTSSMMARVGSSAAPYIIDVLGEIHYTLPLTVFGALSLAAGLLTFLLPETLNKPLPQTVEEVETKKK